jgi:hypothetical protein
VINWSKRYTETGPGISLGIILFVVFVGKLMFFRCGCILTNNTVMVALRMAARGDVCSFCRGSPFPPHLISPTYIKKPISFDAPRQCFCFSASCFLDFGHILHASPRTLRSPPVRFFVSNLFFSPHLPSVSLDFCVVPLWTHTDNRILHRNHMRSPPLLLRRATSPRSAAHFRHPRTSGMKATSSQI